MSPAARKLDTPRGTLAGGRPAPPPPPAGPISRVSASLLLRRPPAPPGPPARAHLLVAAHALRRNVCPHFGMTSARGHIPLTAPHVLKALMRYEGNISRCHLRGGVHLEPEYVADVCLAPRFNQCVFYEDELSRR
ncbi:MAG TPA: hypothetical protein VNW68_02325 [Candidatus Limnocylindria bacterium]|nr:hypothetical protein [Candidatus Limnocylindria bacterium]